MSPPVLSCTDLGWLDLVQAQELSYLQLASSEWPVSSTLHRPTLSRTVRTRLADAEYDIDEIEETIDEHDYLTPHGG